MKEKTSKFAKMNMSEIVRRNPVSPLSIIAEYMFKCILIPVFAAICILLSIARADAAVSAVSLTVPAPTVMSDGKGYYLAGSAASSHTYVFTVSAVNPGATAWLPSYSSVSVSIPTDGPTIMVTTNDGLSCTTSGDAYATMSRSGSWSNPTFTFTVRFAWTAAASVNMSRTVTATVVAGVTRTDTELTNYGICSGISVANFTQSDSAADGYISRPVVPSPNTFHVKGTVVYDIPAYISESVSDLVDNTELVAPLTLELQGSTLTSSGINTSSFDRIISVNDIPASGGNYTWRITMPTVPVKTSVAGLSLRVNTVIVTDISISGGMGRGLYHKYGTPGPQMTLAAKIVVPDGSGTAMHGDTDFTIQMTNGTLTGSFRVTIPSGQSSVTVNLPYDTASFTAYTGATGSFSVADVKTEDWSYSVSKIESSSGYNLNQGPDPFPSAHIYWDKNDPPTTDTSYVTIASVLPSASGVTIYWTPESYTTTTTPLPAVYNEDFYEYRIHFREQSGQWRIWDSASDATLAWPVSSLDTNVTGGSKYTTIPNLKIFTTYEYYVTAVDIFGNESNGGKVPLDYDEDDQNNPLRIHRFKTLPYSIDVTLSDGITSYPDSSFADLTPSVRPLKEANVRVVMRIIGATELPEVVRVWYTIGDTSTAPDIVSISESSNTINSGAFAAGALESSLARKTSSNEWTAYLSTQTSIIKAGNNVRFIVESVKDGVSSFSDHILDMPTSNPNLSEWTFCIASGTTFTPWPVRILNNVITNKKPLAYPSYYLSDPAYVTITVYDVRGQQIVTLLDGAYRQGGQNIKENGWNGKNKAGRDCGPGLYFIHFKAKRASDGKVILDVMKKAVIAR